MTGGNTNFIPGMANPSSPFIPGMANPSYQSFGGGQGGSQGMVMEPYPSTGGSGSCGSSGGTCGKK